MKKMVFILSMVLIATTCASPCMAKQKKVTYKYNASSKTLTVSGKYLKGKLPSKTGGYNQAARYKYQWSSLKGKAKKITLKKGVERIGHNAFGEFAKLNSVKFPNTLKKIDAYAFGSTPIYYVYLPDSVKYIGESAFDMDGEERGIVKLKLSRNLKSIGKAAFRQNKIKEVVIPSNVEKIGAHAFVECNNLKRIVIKSKKLKKVGSRAFADMGKDAVIYIPKERETEYRKMIEDSTAHAQIIAQ
ncbi:MAG: leucine-rich repeat domain-containing protein [Eubacterium sp.]